MIRIVKDVEHLLLQYQVERSSDASWIDIMLNEQGEVRLPVRTFTFKPEDLLPTEVSEDDWVRDDTRTFILGTLEGDYYIIRADILGIQHDLKLHKEMRLTPKTFTAYRDIPIFTKIDRLIEEPIIVGGEAEAAIPVEEFEYLLKNFPNSTELKHYANSRITRILKDYFSTMSDAQQKLSDYLERRERKLSATAEEARTHDRYIKSPILASYEQAKFKYVRDELKSMLRDVESYSEKQWQDLIVGFLLIIFPKYIAVLPNLHVKDFYINPQRAIDTLTSRLSMPVALSTL